MSKIEFMFLNVDLGEEVPVVVDSTMTAESLACAFKALTDHGHVMVGVSFDDAAVGCTQKDIETEDNNHDIP